MKKGLLLLLIVLATTSAEAQNDFIGWKKSKMINSSEVSTTLLCDSIVKKDYTGNSIDKIINGFNGNGKLINRTRYLWDDFSHEWTPDGRYEYDYDKDGNLIVQTYANWNIALKSWKYEEKVESTYNENHKILSQSNYIWQENSWQHTFQGNATYDERGNILIEESKQYYPSIQGWMKSKNEYTYNDLNQWLSAIYYGGIRETEEYIPSFRTTYAYTEQGKMTLRYMQDWDQEQKKWTDTSKEIWTIDETGNEIESISMFKDFETGELVESAKHEKNYDKRGNMILDLFYNKNGDNNWTLSKKDEYTYNEMDSILTKTNYEKDFISGEITPSMKYEYTYDERGNRLTFLSSYHGADGNWAASMKEEKTYNQSNQTLAIKKYFWNIDMESGEGSWLMTYKADYTYDINNYQTSTLIYIYDQMNETWTGQQKSESTFDESGNILEEIIYQWVENIEDFKKAGSIAYYYSNSTSILLSKANKPAVIMENGYIKVFCDELSSIAIYDTSGKLISKDKRTIQVVKRGVYIIVINNTLRYKIMAN